MADPAENTLPAMNSMRFHGREVCVGFFDVETEDVGCQRMTKRSRPVISATMREPGKRAATSGPNRSLISR